MRSLAKFSKKAAGAATVVALVASSVCAPSVASVFAHVVNFNPLFAQFYCVK